MHDFTVGTASTPSPDTGSAGRVVHHKGDRIEFTEDQITRLFWGKVNKTIAGCWEWTGKKLPIGYGQLTIAKRHLYSHRVSYEIHKGAISDGLHIDHLCRNRACCNPDHLEAVTCAENIRRSPIAVATINAAKTHCVNGHEYTPENTLLIRTGRNCRQCKRERDLQRYHAKRADARGVAATAQQPSPAQRPTAPLPPPALQALARLERALRTAASR